MSPARRATSPGLPELVVQKLSKTGYTRGATVREIYQNRVVRNNPVLIPWEHWSACKQPNDDSGHYENGFIVLVEPSWYFAVPDADDQLAAEGVELGVNALLVFRRRSDWVSHRPPAGRLANGKRFDVATSRTNPLGGVYFARVAATVSDEGFHVIEGFNTTALRGAGIRVYEYASKMTIESARIQLEVLLWHCRDADAALESAGMTGAEMALRRSTILFRAQQQGLTDIGRLQTLRMLDVDRFTVCPLCLNQMAAADFFKRTQQASGREVHDLTTTEVSLFHIQELRIGKLQHKPYNLAWGHHFCNVVVKDAGIMPTLQWMRDVLANQPTLDLRAVAQSVEEAVDQ